MTLTAPTPEPPMTIETADHTAAVLELLASRICHDLISPVGAINNGLEFMQEAGGDKSAMDEAVGLVSFSASQAAAKLAAFRMAYGAGGRDPNLKPEDVQKAFSALTSGDGKISQMWDPFGSLGPAKPYPRGFCKMLMCSMMLAMECLPKGGAVSVRPGIGAQTLIFAEGDGATVRDMVASAMAGTAEPQTLDPRLVHPYAIGVLARSYGYSLKITEQVAGKITFTLDCPAPAAPSPV